MCTLSWEFCSESYTLLFSRDELKRRAPAEPIREVKTSAGMRLIHPVDAEKGGSWIVVNERGLTTCLLNLYECSIPEPPVGGFESRGWLVMQLAESRSWEETMSLLSAIDPVRFPPFHLFQFDPILGVLSMKWTGVEVAWIEHPERCEQPASGSSFKNDEVVAKRRSAYKKLVKATDSNIRISELKQFHEWQDPENRAFSVKMMRPDAQTMSVSTITVNSQWVEFEYQSRDVDEEGFEEPMRLSLKRTCEVGDCP